MKAIELIDIRTNNKYKPFNSNVKINKRANLELDHIIRIYIRDIMPFLHEKNLTDFRDLEFKIGHFCQLKTIKKK